MLRMSDLDLSDKKVLIREDLNVPILNGEITSDARIRAILPTLDIALKANCGILIMSHMGRPTEGEYNLDYSFLQNHIALATSFGEIEPPHPVYPHVKDFPEIVLLENDANNPPDTDEWHTDVTFKSFVIFLLWMHLLVLIERMQVHVE